MSKEQTFENAGDLKFSDLGPPSEREPTEEGIARRQAADAEAVWDATCQKCGAKITGTREKLIAHGTACATAMEKTYDPHP